MALKKTSGTRKDNSRSRAIRAPVRPRLFISHSSKDHALVQLLVDLLKEALDLTTEEIRCTSLPGYGLQGGAPVDETIRTEVDQAEVLVGLISEASLDSLYVAFELGARWHAGTPLIPLLTRDLDVQRVRGPLSGKHALTCSNAGLFRLIEDVEGYLGLPKNSKTKNSALFPKINAICEYAPERPTPEWHGARFTAPDDGAAVQRRLLSVAGTFKHKPAHGAFHLFLASVDWNRWWPIAEPRLKDDGTWSADVEFEKGHQPYDAWLVMALVSASSSELVSYFKTLPRYLEMSHRDGRGELEKHQEFNSLFGKLKPDGIAVCDQRRVHVSI